MNADRWADARRVEAWAGEVRVNLLRTIALAVFYGQHLLNVHVFYRDDPRIHGNFDLAVAAIVLAWGVAAFVLYLCLSRRWVPPALKYLATLTDLVLVTALLIANEDPRSPFLFLYFVVIAASPLRLSLRLVQATTFGTWAAALVLMGHYVFFHVGRDVYYDPRPDNPYRVPRTAEVLFLLSTGAAGLFAGQIVRQARRLLQGYPVAVEEPREGA